jgi:hypothetical protein
MKKKEYPNGAFINYHMLSMLRSWWNIHPWSFVNMDNLSIQEFFSERKDES